MFLKNKRQSRVQLVRPNMDGRQWRQVVTIFAFWWQFENYADMCMTYNGEQTNTVANRKNE